MRIIKFAAAITLCLFVAYVGSYFTKIDIWYYSINKPFFTPPNWFFPIIWSIIYILMGISLSIILISDSAKKEALALFSLQLLLNVAWSYTFFTLHELFGSIIIIIALWFAIIATIFEFEKISKNASRLLYLYLVWVSIATILNISILLLN